jgi:hypothetical protein
MSFAGLWPQPCRGLESCFGLGEPGPSVIEARNCINGFVRISELAIGVEK